MSSSSIFKPILEIQHSSHESIYIPCIFSIDHLSIGALFVFIDVPDDLKDPPLSILEMALFLVWQSMVKILSVPLESPQTRTFLGDCRQILGPKLDRLALGQLQTTPVEFFAGEIKALLSK